MFKGIFLIVILVSVLGLWFRNFELNNIFFPSKEITYTPNQFGIEYKEVTFETEDNLKLNAWFIPAGPQQSNSSNLTILFSHGNGANISNRIEKISFLRDLGLDVFIYDYRGYGNSQGQPSEAGIYRDGKAAYDYLVKQENISPDKIIAFGESLGAAVTTFLAKNFKLKAMILEGAFTNAKDMAKEIYPFLPSFLIRSQLDNVKNIKNSTIPKLFLHAQLDEIVPYEFAKKLFDNVPEPKYFCTLRGQHNSAFLLDQDTTREAVRSFLGNL